MPSLFLCFCSNGFLQDTLPRFTVSSESGAQQPRAGEQLGSKEGFSSKHENNVFPKYNTNTNISHHIEENKQVSD